MSFLLYESLNGYFNRPPGHAGDIRENELAYYVALKRSLPINATEGITPILNSLEKQKDKSTEAAMMWGIYRDVEGKEIKASDLKVLEKSDSKADKATFDILTKDKLNSTQASTLIEALPKREATQYLRFRALEKSGKPVDWRYYDRRSTRMMTGVGAALLIAFIGFMLMVAYIAGRSQGKFKPLGHPALPMTQFESDAYAMRALMVMLLISFLPYIVQMITGGAAGTSTLAALLCVGAVIGMCRMRLWGVRTDRWKLSNAVSGWKAFGQGALIYLMGLPFIGLMMILGPLVFRGFPNPEHPTTTAIPSATPIQLVGIFAMAVIQAPIVEEIAFRGSILPALTRVLRSPIASVILTNVLFAAIHPTGIPAWPALAAIGMVASFAVYQTGSIWPAVAVHAIHNGVTLVLSLAALR